MNLFPYLFGSHEGRHQLSAQQIGVWRHRADDVRIHEIDETLPAFGLVPSDPLVSYPQVEHRIAQSENADQLAVGSIPDQEAQSSAVTLRDRDRPSKRSEPEDVTRVALRDSFNQLRLDGLGVHLVAIGELVHEPIKLVAQDTENALLGSSSVDSVNLSNGLLRQDALRPRTIEADRREVRLDFLAERLTIDGRRACRRVFLLRPVLNAVLMGTACDGCASQVRPAPVSATHLCGSLLGVY